MQDTNDTAMMQTGLPFASRFLMNTITQMGQIMPWHCHEQTFDTKASHASNGVPDSHKDSQPSIDRFGGCMCKGRVEPFKQWTVSGKIER